MIKKRVKMHKSKRSKARLRNINNLLQNHSHVSVCLYCIVRAVVSLNQSPRLEQDEAV